MPLIDRLIVWGWALGIYAWAVLQIQLPNEETAAHDPVGALPAGPNSSLPSSW
ncbi:MAG: hypothetical protein J0M24_16140 [Verrucomicrobia bacterium]|nr:hypothetical protein [Verrucomicrobiota bacterium]